MVAMIARGLGEEELSTAPSASRILLSSEAESLLLMD